MRREPIVASSAGDLCLLVRARWRSGAASGVPIRRFIAPCHAAPVSAATWSGLAAWPLRALARFAKSSILPLPRWLPRSGVSVFNLSVVMVSLPRSCATTCVSSSLRRRRRLFDSSRSLTPLPAASASGASFIRPAGALSPPRGCRCPGLFVPFPSSRSSGARLPLSLIAATAPSGRACRMPRLRRRVVPPACGAWPSSPVRCHPASRQLTTSISFSPSAGAINVRSLPGASPAAA